MTSLHPMRYIRKIKKVIEWLPLIWRDEDWDFCYLLYLMRYKLQRMSKCIGDVKIISHTEDVVAELAKADVLLRNVIEEDPDDEWNLHYNQWHIGKEMNDRCNAENECHRDLALSAKRSATNWHKLWKHLDKYAQGWWN